MSRTIECCPGQVDLDGDPTTGCEYACLAFDPRDTESPETCNGWDDDCDGQIDEAHNCDGRTQPVARFEANPWGLYDMPGNLAEIVADPYVAMPASDPTVDPVGSVDDELIQITLRGCGHDSEAAECRSASRGGQFFERRTLTSGFRLVRSLAEER